LLFADEVGLSVEVDEEAELEVDAAESLLSALLAGEADLSSAYPLADRLAPEGERLSVA